MTPEEDREVSRKHNKQNRNILYMPKPNGGAKGSKRACQEKIPIIREKSTGKEFKNRFTGEKVTSYTPEEDRRYRIEDRQGRSRKQMNIENDSYRKYPQTVDGMKMRARRLGNKMKTVRKTGSYKIKQQQLHDILTFLDKMEKAMNSEE